MDPVDPPNVEAMLQLALLAMLRPGAAFLAAPVFGAANVPVQLRLVLALAVGLPSIGMSAIALPEAGLVSWPGLVLVLGELVIGIALGFVLQMALAAALIAGEAISNTMGLGFAMMIDPMSGAMNSSIGQFLALLATALFLSADGHLILASAIAESYRAFPVGNAFPDADAIGSIVGFGSVMFKAGLAVALPVGFALVLIQIVMGVMGRSAPAFNLFSVGFPATLLAGMVMMAIALPSMSDAITVVLGDAVALTRMLAGG